ncbi:MAG: ACT domain-containing protein, partial [Bacillota bacterium]|nr:ACT domain-containing protein [Bacillota bacterium]
SVSDIPFDSKNIAKIFSNIASKNIIVDMISQTAPHNNLINISFTVEKNDLYDLEVVLVDLKSEMPSCDFSFNDEVVKLSIIGVGMISQSGVASKLFDVFSENSIHFYQVTTSEISISYTVHRDDLENAINIIAKVFEL